MLELESVTDTYRLIVKKGILTEGIIDKEDEDQFITEWLMMTALLPATCTTELLTKKYKTELEDLNKIFRTNKKVCLINIFDEPILCFYFDKDGIIFEPLCEALELTFSDWADLWMYDLRLHGAIGYLLLLIDKYKQRRLNEN